MERATSSESSAGAHASPSKPGQGSTSCVACKKQKMRCVRPASSTASTSEGGPLPPCERCIRNKRACEQPAATGQRGRRNRTRGVERALLLIESELERSRKKGGGDVTSIASEDVRRRSALALGAIAGARSPQQQSTRIQLDAPAGTPYHLEDVSEEQQVAGQMDVPAWLEEAGLLAEGSAGRQPAAATGAQAQGRGGGSAPAPLRSRLEDASRRTISHPLGLVAVASAPSGEGDEGRNATIIEETSVPEIVQALLQSSDTVRVGTLSQESIAEGLESLLAPPTSAPSFANVSFQTYFADLTRVSIRRDLGPDLDPIDLALVTEEEAQALFALYFDRLAPFHGILDPLLHTPAFVRARSAMLFTSILAAAAQFAPDAGALAKRLRLHGERLSLHAYQNASRSVEVVQAYYIAISSATPSSSLREERTVLYTHHAYGLASELGLDIKISEATSPSNIASRAQTPVGSPRPEINGPQPTETERACSLAKVLEDDFAGWDPTSLECATRVLRNRERTWLRIVLWERSVSSVRGHAPSFNESELTRSIETWWLHPYAISVDQHAAALISLRRLLARLHSEVQTTRERHAEPADPHWVKELADKLLGAWKEEWAIGGSTHPFTSRTETMENFYTSIVQQFGRLWVLSFALSERVEDQAQRAGKQDCMEAAIECCELVITNLAAYGDALHGMQQSIWAMISYAAIVCLKLFPSVHGAGREQSAQLLGLLAQVARHLLLAGTTPSHRFGMAALFGQHLNEALRQRARVLKDWVGREGVSDAVGAPTAEDFFSFDLQTFFNDTTLFPLPPMFPDPFHHYDAPAGTVPGSFGWHGDQLAWDQAVGDPAAFPST